jgi:hypothetical protein
VVVTTSAVPAAKSTSIGVCVTKRLKRSIPKCPLTLFLILKAIR